MLLSPRLQLIADLVKSGSVLADIGTDHGYVPVYCVMNEKCKKAIAMDVNMLPLKKAEENIEKYGLTDRITTRLSNGLEALEQGEADSVVIAGMGGLLIRNILEEGKKALCENTQLILQPMLAQKELRQYLYSNGYDIENEYVCREEDKFYNIICACVKTLEAPPSDKDIVLGKNADINSPEVYMEYLDYKYGVCQKIINGMKKSKNPDEAELESICRDNEIIEKERVRFSEGK